MLAEANKYDPPGARPLNCHDLRVSRRPSIAEKPKWLPPF